MWVVNKFFESSAVEYRFQDDHRYEMFGAILLSFAQLWWDFWPLLFFDVPLSIFRYILNLRI